jgi:hypothetical protein
MLWEEGVIVALFISMTFRIPVAKTGSWIRKFVHLPYTCPLRIPGDPRIQTYSTVPIVSESFFNFFFCAQARFSKLLSQLTQIKFHEGRSQTEYAIMYSTVQ